ncbi:hypothetical protein PHJA_000915300 [Phtheirospermum japonicum]|uniref:Uncharacterized protein n=1 Tax=Phtheirospermum japonicum TaxID=374723 RepID=A0A830BLP8_9LAMI|nr:hypothetical protein PHJA_000915300 [Phtheirospermum japonicum]
MGLTPESNIQDLSRDMENAPTKEEAPGRGLSRFTEHVFVLRSGNRDYVNNNYPEPKLAEEYDLKPDKNFDTMNSILLTLAILSIKGQRMVYDLKTTLQEFIGQRLGDTNKGRDRDSAIQLKESRQRQRRRIIRRAANSRFYLQDCLEPRSAKAVAKFQNRELGIDTFSTCEDEKEMLRLAQTMFDTKLPPGVTMLQPFSDESSIKKIAVQAFPEELFSVLRTVHLLRGLSVGLGINYSCAEQWKPLAEEALYLGRPTDKDLKGARRHGILRRVFGN